uniref:nucleolar and coiled-body phosphoprotein 1-like n=1 Tax=Styela clava TaxID=7725 RepID=UPI00193A1344|nr:nucleolar and coiled-body phosphoprotein 1-like [Styela clava]
MMSASVQLNTADDRHVGKTMPTIKPNVLYSTAKLRIDRSTIEDSENSKYGSTKDIMRALSMDDSKCTNNDLQIYRPIKSNSRTSKRSVILHPPSPCAGVSDECIAMVRACSHDHDYSGQSLEVLSPRSMNDGKDVFKRQSISPGVIIKREPDEVIDVSSLGASKEINRTPRPARYRPGRIVLVRKGSIDLKSVAGAQKDLSSAAVEKRSTENVVFQADTRILGRCEEPKERQSERDSSFTLRIGNESKIFKDCNNDFDGDITSPRPSITPFPPAEKRRSRRSSSTFVKKVDLVNEDAVKLDKEIKKEPDDKDSENCNVSIDSAYSSLNFSSASKPRTPSGNRPASGGKRSATCGLTSSSSSGASSDEWSDLESPRNPQSNSTTLLTDPDNAATEKVDSDIENESITVGVVPDDKSRGKSPRPSITASRHHRKITSGKKLKKHSAQHNTTEATTTNPNTYQQKSQEKIQFVPTPPTRKPKKGKYYRSVPMRLRALPTSFWEEPNRTNPSSYTILPPVQPLFHQHENEDIADIRPVTPPNEKETSGSSRQTISATGCDRPRNRTIIRTGDTDLLLRLFDKVEAKQQNQTGIRAKRGRPKRPSYCTMTTSRRNHNDNPCIMNSITEKLFPKLSLGHRHPIAAMMTSSAIAASAALPLRSVSDATTEEPTQSHATKFNGSGPQDFNSAMFLTEDDSPSSSLNFGTEVAMEMSSSSPSPTLQPKPSPILPQLVMQKEYSHLLNELAAVL